jgi:hypothetical protein
MSELFRKLARDKASRWVLADGMEPAVIAESGLISGGRRAGAKWSSEKVSPYVSPEMTPKWYQSLITLTHYFYFDAL